MRSSSTRTIATVAVLALIGSTAIALCWWTIHRMSVKRSSIAYSALSSLRQKWTYSTGNVIIGSPLICEKGIAFCDAKNQVYMINEKGSCIWKCYLQAYLTSMLSVDNDTILATGKDMLKLANDGEIQWITPMVSVTSPAMPYHLGYLVLASGGTTLDYVSSNGVFQSLCKLPAGRKFIRMLLSDERLLCSSESGSLVLVDLNNNKLLWTYEIGSVVRGKIAHDSVSGNYYAVSETGRMVGIDSAGRLLWQTYLNGPISSSPVFANKQIIAVNTEGVLFIVDDPPHDSIKYMDLSVNPIMCDPIIDNKSNIWIGGRYNIFSIDPTKSINLGELTFSDDVITAITYRSIPEELYIAFDNGDVSCYMMNPDRS